jgi:hypothetical protein
MKIALVTAVIGGIDEIKEVPEQTLKYDRLVFTEPFPGTENLSPRNQALYYKTQIHTFGNYDFYIWIDGKVQVTSGDFIEQCLAALTDNIAILKHHERTCIYQEVDHIEHCIKKGNEYLKVRYANRPIRKQVDVYKSCGYPANNGLNDCCIFVVRGQTMWKVFNDWWYECSYFDWFDQTSIQFLCWHNKKKINSIIFKPGSFKDIPHVK